MHEISIKKPDDFHLHLRQGESLKHYAQASAKYFKKVLIMPNTQPPITTANEVNNYHQAIQKVCPELEVYTTFKLNPKLKFRDIEDLANTPHLIGGKLYPQGVTTHSEDGIQDIKTLAPIFEIMQNKGIVLNVHAEDLDSFCLERERNYLIQVDWVIKNFPKLKIVIEHISDRASVEFVNQKSHLIAATITVHHLLLTLDNVIGGNIEPHHFCKPIAKTPKDLKALQKAAFSQNPKFFFGTDSAPHLKNQKECSQGCAGIFSSLVAIPLLTELFEKHNQLTKLENFTSIFGSKFYELPLNQEILTLKKIPWQVPNELQGVIPFFANQILTWK